MHGNKAENLKRLVKVNYNVPAFLAFDISETDKIFDTIINAHPDIKYWAVRSSSAEEDGVISSAAGKISFGNWSSYTSFAIGNSKSNCEYA
ncbi:MAG: hypothetical protein IPH61_13945 [Bacteroidetes bacterium]|nr:hypothetical protein [Bacteroidota bacterium]